MAQRVHQQWEPGNGGTGWLSTLVETFNKAERLGSVPCDRNLLSAMHARLAEPALLVLGKPQAKPPALPRSQPTA